MPLAKAHTYEIRTEWTGNRGSGTSSYNAYSRDHQISAAGKAVVLPGSSDKSFRGDASRYNPEELLVSSLSACHMLWFLHLCADAGIAVVSYQDEARGVMHENADGSGLFVDVVLHPTVELTEPRHQQRAEALHHTAHHMCFIARSVNFPVSVRPAWVRSSQCQSATE
jgi:organic hydroperoxide reductase OsmC/OhrA